MGKKIVYETSTGQEYDLAYGSVRIAVSPSMIGSMKNASVKAEELMKKLSDITPEEIAPAEAEMRSLLNEAFGTDICTPAFGSDSMFTVTKSGKYLFEEFFDAFMPELEKDIRAMQIKTPELRPEVKKYISSPVKPIAGLSQPYSGGLPDVSRLSPEQKKQLAMQLLSQQ